MLLDDERYAVVVSYGKDAVTKLQENKVEEGFAAAEKGWKAFPGSGARWNQGYNYAKSFFIHAIQKNNMGIAESWLNRMIENNDELHLFDFEIEHMKAKYAFEIGNLDEAFNLWKNLVSKKGVGYRYFDFDDVKYKKFYQSKK
ncbi:hypothetical protein E4O04_06105 [Treponema sp. OMZ 799]|nr:hypothetical protein [Treponema sp. OMZ 799]UTC77596.1 hypothetical protein E4O04_06105 [Treponema sp. OMZ 799]